MVHPLRKFLAVLPPPTLYKVETRKKFLDTGVQHCLWGEGRGWTCVNWKTPQKWKWTQYFCPWLCLHQKLQSVTPLNWTCIATFLVHNVKLWSNFRNVFSGLGYSSTKFYPGRFNLEVQLLTLIVYYIYHFSQKRKPFSDLLLTNGIPSLSLDIPEPGKASPHNEWLHWKTSRLNSFATVKQIARQEKNCKKNCRG